MEPVLEYEERKIGIFLGAQYDVQEGDHTLPYRHVDIDAEKPILVKRPTDGDFVPLGQPTVHHTERILVRLKQAISYSSFGDRNREARKRINDDYRQRRETVLSLYSKLSVEIAERWLKARKMRAELPPRVPTPVLEAVPDKVDWQKLSVVLFDEYQAAKRERRALVRAFTDFEWSVFKAQAKQEHPLWSRRTLLRKWRRYQKKKILPRIQETPLDLSRLRKLREEAYKARDRRGKIIASNRDLLREHRDRFFWWRLETEDRIAAMRELKSRLFDSLKQRRKNLKDWKERQLAVLAKEHEDELKALKNSQETEKPSDYLPFYLSEWKAANDELCDYFTVHIPHFVIEGDLVYGYRAVQSEAETVVKVPIRHRRLVEPQIGTVAYFSTQDVAVHANEYDKLFRKLVTPRALGNFKAAQQLLELKDIPRTIKDVIHFIKWVIQLRKGKVSKLPKGLDYKRLLKLCNTSIKGACKAYLWYMFGAEPTVDTVNSAVKSWSEWTGSPIGELLVQPSALSMTIDVKKSQRAADDHLPPLRWQAASSDNPSTTMLSLRWKTVGREFQPILDVENIERWLAQNWSSFQLSVAQNLPAKRWRDDLTNRKVFCKVVPDFDAGSLKSTINALWFDSPVLSTTWELAPMSFLIDWFVDLGKMLREREQVMAQEYWIANAVSSPPWVRTLVLKSYPSYINHGCEIWFRYKSAKDFWRRTDLGENIFTSPSDHCTIRGDSGRKLVYDCILRDVCRQPASEWDTLWSGWVYETFSHGPDIKIGSMRGAGVKLSLALSLLFGMDHK